MKVAVLGVWHVHAKDYAKHAIEHAEVLGFYERDDKLGKMSVRCGYEGRLALKLEKGKTYFKTVTRNWGNLGKKDKDRLTPELVMKFINTKE